MGRFAGLVVVAMLGAGDASLAQNMDPDYEERGPRFLLASTGAPVRVDLSKTPVLRRRISLELHGAGLADALRQVSEKSGVRLAFSNAVLPPDRRVEFQANNITVAAALTELLIDAGVDVLFSRDGRAVIVQRRDESVQTTIVGRVTDAKTGQGLEGAEVLLQGTRWQTLTGPNGQYRLADVDTGTYVVTARRIGYTRQSRSVTVAEGQETTADFALQAAVTKLDELVTTGTLVPSAVKAVPTPITVITEEQIAAQRPQNMQDLFRKAVPGAVSWDSKDVPYNTQFSVRGASSLVPGSPSMKVFIDGIEAANAGISQVDPNSIARVEVIRGPQATAIYGAEAIGGVIQIFTKRGDASLRRPQLGAEAAVGAMQTPYAGFAAVVRQEYKASIRGGAPDIGYYLGSGYAHTGHWLPPAGEYSRQSRPTVYGGITFSRDMVTADISGRYLSENGGNRIFNPELQQSGFVPFSTASFQTLEVQNQTVGARLQVTPRPWWRSSVTVGVDRFTRDLAQLRPRFATAADTLLQVGNRVESKPSIGVTTSVEGALAPGVFGVVTAGVTHWVYRLSNWSTVGALTTTGTIRPAPGQSISATRTIVENTGYFSQVQLGFRDQLFVTAGLRGERNTDFGDSLGMVVLPRVGLSYVRGVGSATFKLRTSWGKAIRAPSPGAKVAFTSASGDQLANPNLAPERQQGWDAGVDVTFGSRASVGVTYYDQTADNLLDAVVLAVAPVRTQQFQNVGRVRNTGIEIEGSLVAGPLSLQGQYAYTRARVARLSPTYGGDLLVGDQVVLRPKHLLGAALVAVPLAGTTVSAAVSYVGSWTEADYIAQFKCIGGTGPCRPTSRDYLMAYPSLFKINIGMVQDLSTALAGFLAIENLTNNTRHEISNLNPVTGRSSMVGLRLRY